MEVPNKNTQDQEQIHSPLRPQDFDFAIKKRRPMWQRMVLGVFCFGALWAGTHGAMNFSAFSQIAEFKVNELVASVFEEPEAAAEEVVKHPLKRLQADEKETDVPVSYAPTLNSFASYLFDEVEAYPSDDRLVIPRIGKNIPLISVSDNTNWNMLERGIQNGLRNGVVVHPISRDPSSVGNFFLTGHSSYYAWDDGAYKDVFALLHEVELGDDIVLYWKGKKYEYVIEESKVVAPTEVSVLEQPTDEKILTLMTCTPIGTDTNRLIKIAVPKNGRG